MGKYINEPRLLPSSDDKGRNVKFQVRMPPDWQRQIDVIVKSSKFPYVNRGEVARDAIYRHLVWLEKFEIPQDSILHKIQSMTDLLEEAKIQQGYERIITNLEERVSYFIQKGARNEAVKYVLRMLGYVDEMAEGHWKAQFRKEIKDRYKGLLRCGPRASLGMGSDNEHEEI
jgi:hypothetical protein